MDFDIDLLGFDDAFFVEEGVTIAEDEWQGMPEFDQPDGNSFRHVIVHFKNNDDANEFFSIIGQTNTDKTKSIWFPEVEIETYMDKVYE